MPSPPRRGWPARSRWPRALRPPRRLSAADGQQVEVQSCPLAYWPDGCLKWTGHAITAPAGLAGPFELRE